MITMKDIIREGNPILRQVAKEVDLPPTDEEKEILEEMLQFLKNSQDPEIAEQYDLRAGIGIAAPQIGISKRMFCAHLTDENDNLFSYALFNPKIISHSVQMSYLEGGEGCLSVDRPVEGLVPRYARITVTAHDLYKGDVKLRLRGLPAINFQHEIDHLNGVMFYDRIDKDDPYKVPPNSIAIDR
ncbi:MAG TPA: peptide deformylase [Bacillales bacterium]|nr:peptide deformylase [Bacillales bacterium]